MEAGGERGSRSGCTVGRVTVLQVAQQLSAVMQALHMVHSSVHALQVRPLILPPPPPPPTLPTIMLLALHSPPPARARERRCAGRRGRRPHQGRRRHRATCICILRLTTAAGVHLMRESKSQAGTAAAALPSLQRAHDVTQQRRLCIHHLGAAVHTLLLISCRVEARQLPLALGYRVVNVVVPLEVALPPRYNVYVEVRYCLPRRCAVLHRKLQAFGVEGARDGCAHTLRKLPHVTHLRWQQVSEELALSAGGDEDVAGDMQAALEAGSEGADA